MLLVKAFQGFSQIHGFYGFLMLSIIVVLRYFTRFLDKRFTLGFLKSLYRKFVRGKHSTSYRR